MGIKPIKTKRDHERALKEIEGLMIEDPRPDTPAGDRLEVLAKLIEDYERERFAL